MTVGERIKAIREQKDISQEELAKKLGLKDKSSVCKIEKSGDNISTRSIRKYAEALGTTAAVLMGWTKAIPTDVMLEIAVDAMEELDEIESRRVIMEIQDLSKDNQERLKAYYQKLIEIQKMEEGEL